MPNVTSGIFPFISKYQSFKAELPMQPLDKKYCYLREASLTYRFYV